ncbi:ChaN family lipoprotein [Paremcibacter congregatus]|uniref:Haem-binding uptake Tiki superfamily ChaN domain-containing protein n=1 Tax=Paremcibacter congregatus TaxID=2043170 RepID=A0A2G4YT61_9PROT|nr:ChaN family lipoprotein [Paremcibacter congregatus]PHZ85532.1 hypothetical protein CRD36_02215 [Paremcibacter congregatus]QDE26490.1 ChaN family lipoprotein [Paremcibacter congregatus]
MKTIGIIVLLLVQMSGLLPGPAMAQTPDSATPIWDRQTKKFISQKQLHKKIVPATALLLATDLKTPVPVHQIIQIIRHLESHNRNPALILSMIERDKQNAFQIITQRNKNENLTAESRGLEILLTWNNSGKPLWQQIKPLFDFAYEKSLPLIAADFARHEVGSIHQRGLSGLPDDVKTALLPALQPPLPPADVIRHKARLKGDFCLDLPAETVDKLILAHRSRTALYSHILQEQRQQFPDQIPVLITTTDHRVKEAEGLPLIRIAFQETLDGSDADFVWLTTTSDRPDLCQN